MLPESFPLSGAALRDWLRTDGQGIFSQFSSGAEALDFFRSQGGAIRTQDFYNIRREVLDLTKYQGQLGALREDSLIPVGWTSYDHGLKLAENFLYRVEITGKDPTTGAATSRFVSVYSMDQLTKGDVFDQAGALVSGLEDFYGIVPESFDLAQSLGRAEPFEME